jgi:hypothetical protein
MVKSVAFLMLGALVAVAPAPAHATVYDWVQASASLPGLQFNVTITVDGTLNDLPTLNSHTATAPINFGDLTGVTFSGGGVSASFSDFVIPTGVSDFPDWRIGPGPGIDFVNDLDSEDFEIGPNLITANTDGSGLCSETGACSATGEFVAVAEPSTVPLLLAALLAMFGVRLGRPRWADRLTAIDEAGQG